jgi:hypothetical protein
VQFCWAFDGYSNMRAALFLWLSDFVDNNRFSLTFASGSSHVIHSHTESVSFASHFIFHSAVKE